MQAHKGKFGMVFFSSFSVAVNPLARLILKPFQTSERFPLIEAAIEKVIAVEYHPTVWNFHRRMVDGR